MRNDRLNISRNPLIFIAMLPFRDLPLQRAIRAAGSLRVLARLLGEYEPTVCNWQHRGVPPEKCIAVELAVDRKVTRYELRPDIFCEPAEPT